ncbi:uncharacterized protein isoform X3 [Danio rerio]|uniref:Uncharacterized protein isoform X3 n=1 Tax=Danio rerio TaxID=7955 RepID=A0AC58GTQ6_DANRE
MYITADFTMLFQQHQCQCPLLKPHSQTVQLQTSIQTQTCQPAAPNKQQAKIPPQTSQTVKQCKPQFISFFDTAEPTSHTSTDQPTTAKCTAVSTAHISTEQLSTTTGPLTKDAWVKVLAFSCAGVILSVFICLSWFASKKRIKLYKNKSVKTDVSSQGNGMSCSGSPEIYSLITSVPATSQPTSEDLEHPESHQPNTADPTDTFITSENPIYQPSDLSVNTQQGNTENNESVYHLYSTIPDKPVQPYTGDQEYSLIQMH